MPVQTTQRDASATSELPSAGLLVDVVVLSADLPLFESIRDAIGERNPVWRARSSEEAVDLLLTGRCGVLLIDMGAVSTQPDTLIQQILDQFPDVVVCVAGRREDEPLLVPLISDGLIYRFMHKPLSAKRAGMFLHAAIRHHVERRTGDDDLRQPLRLVTALPQRYDPLKWLFVAGGVAVFLVVLSSALSHRESPDSAPDAAPATTPVRPVVANATVSRADPVLSRARAAFDAGRYETPSGRNALDLYEAVLLAHPGNAEAQAGLDRTINSILAVAGHEAASGGTPEAQRLVKRVLDVRPQHPAALALAARLQPEAPKPVVADLMPPPAPATSPAPAPAAAAAPVSSPSTASTTPGPSTAAPPPAPAAPPARSVTAKALVEPDPLTPHFVNSVPEVPVRSPVAPRRNGPRSYGAPISSGLPIAGYVNSARTEAAAPAPDAGIRSAAATEAKLPLMPVEEFEKLEVTEPIYPPQALRDRTHGWVEMEFTITETGTVRDIAVVQSEPHGVFEQAAETALGHWRFRPRFVNGQPVAQRSTVILRFDVDG